MRSLDEKDEDAMRKSKFSESPGMPNPVVRQFLLFAA